MDVIMGRCQHTGSDHSGKSIPPSFDSDRSISSDKAVSKNPPTLGHHVLVSVVTPCNDDAISPHSYKTISPHPDGHIDDPHVTFVFDKNHD